MVSSLGQACSQFINTVFQNPFFLSNPIAVVFIISMIPFIPKAEFFLPIISNGGDASGVVIAATFGNIIGEVILYFITKHGSMFLQRREMKQDIDIRKFIHRYSWVIFLIAPFIYIGTDLLVIYAGIRRVKLHHFILPMSIGFAIKNTIIVALAVEGSYLISSILKICSNS